MTVDVSPRRRREVIDALRRGTVPQNGLDLLAVGLARFDAALDGELDAVAGGGSGFKAVRGEYGSGKTFFTRHLAERALRRGFAAAEVQISETETPLHKLETVYRRITETLRTASLPPSAFRSVLDSWLYTVEEDVIRERPELESAGAGAFDVAVSELMEKRLAGVSTRTPAFSLALRAYRSAAGAGDNATADALAAWMGGQPHVAAAAKRAAGVRGDMDHFGALGFLQGLLVVLRDAGHPGLLLVLDEVETLQRMRGDVRDKALNALRQLIDEIDSGRFPGLYLVITGTPAFFDGPSGVQRLNPLAGRLATDFTTDARFDNPRAVQVRLPGFSRDSLIEVGQRVRGVYSSGQGTADRLVRVVDDTYLGDLADGVSGTLGGRVGVAPRLFLKKLVGDVLDRVDQFDDFDPRRHYAVTVGAEELTDAERGAAGARPRGAAGPDDIDLDLG
ncbi:BREX system ATP-binding protein BrxD [Mobilicoccus sp.]|nr:BREX system ATP-binding protein BrxD [Mobilicoccus sp.]